jgi:hypothetical protein
VTSAAMNALIRRAARATQPHRKWEADPDDGGLGGRVIPDSDQGSRTSTAPPPMSAVMDDRIRRAAGINVRPGHRPVPEIGEY